MAQCDEEWEHECGAKIGTLDNPGWYLEVDLDGTILLDKEFNPISYDESTDDWIDCRIRDKQFAGAGGPGKLEELLSVFLEWAKTERDWLAVPPRTPPTQEDLDREFYAILNEVGPEMCKKDGCRRRRVQYSVMCRIHHFEMIRGYVPNFEKT